MENIISLIFRLTSRLTDFFPRSGAGLLDKFIFNTLGSSWLERKTSKKNQALLKRTANFNKICLLADVNIGDAVFMQNVISGLREFFPDAQIDYVIKGSVSGLVSGNPAITNLWPVYTSAPYPGEKDFKLLNQILIRENYDLLFNFFPLIADKNPVFPKQLIIINSSGLVAKIVRAQKKSKIVNNINSQAYQFICDLFLSLENLQKPVKFSGGILYIAQNAVDRAKEFLIEQKLAQGKANIFFNPDASSKFSRIPFLAQVSLLKNLTEFPVNILLGAGHSQKGIELALLSALPQEKKQNIRIVPLDMPLDAYAALIDFCDIFISADTGPLHIAAARKLAILGEYKFRNKTAIFSIFGASQASIYGYDSERQGYLPANQDAPSYAYSAPSPCRNMTCINKPYKTCKKVRCFDGLDIEKITADIRLYLNRVNNQKNSLKI